MLILGLFFLTSCGGNERIQETRAKYFRELELDPDLRLFHPSGDSSFLYFRIPHDGLLYTRPHKQEAFTARVKVTVELRSEDKLRTVDSTFLEDEGKDPDGSSVGRATLTPPSELEQGRLVVKVKDMERGRSVRMRMPFDRKGKNASQNFLPVKKDGEPFFKDHFPAGKTVKLLYRKGSPERFQARYYEGDFPLPPPPFDQSGFRSFDFEADSLFGIEADSGGGLSLEVPEKGFYHVQADSSLDRRGYTLFNFSEGFPEVRTVKSMLGPIRYLTSKEEFERIEGNEDLKEAVDSFWVNLGGSKERGRELIASYYDRVETANRHFTSHMEGWRTDRGLIHIIFGEPRRIEHSARGEEWIYGEENDIMNLHFEFEYVSNPFSLNDMSLSRQRMYKSSWYRALEQWRNGKVYNQ